MRVSAARVVGARHHRSADGEDRPGRRADAARLARSADRRSPGRRVGGGGRAVLQADLHRGGCGVWPEPDRHQEPDRPSDARGGVRAEALRHPQADRARRRQAADLERRQEILLHPEPVGEHAHLQGHADRRSDRDDVSRSDGPRRGVGAGARAPALQHQHVPVVAAGASVPLRRAQRRDQHAARQHQLDARARGDVRVGSVRRGPEEDPAGHPRRRQRHGHLRQRARVPRHDRPLAAARRADDDSRAVGRARNDVRRAQGVLRVSRDDDGAVGRPGVDRVHRRHGHRRGARSQRPAARPAIT